MPAAAERKYESVSAEPVKSFFVQMLTRDISLEDAILDLLDNCVDGIIRTKAPRASTARPYAGFRADITFDGGHFKLSDNCGGIPWSLHNYAWRLGNPKLEGGKLAATVGVYGIGMKRALFKLGKKCEVTTQHHADRYRVTISPDWLSDEGNWRIPVRAHSDRLESDGTVIRVSELNAAVRDIFEMEGDRFKKELSDRIATHYAFIINKGFQVTVNGDTLDPKPIALRVERAKHAAILPYVYQNSIGGVDVFMVVGLTHPIPSEEDVEEEQESPQYSSLDAGWTVVCNDRAVLYCDRSELTGWGEAGVPKYHTQFIAIAGVVEFRSTKPDLLPTTTTKRGINASSTLYLQIKNKMREGMQLFTDFTNKWKGRDLVHEAQEKIKKAPALELMALKQWAAGLRLSTLRSGINGKQYVPKLPVPPPKKSDEKRICFSKSVGEIEQVADYLLNDEAAAPKDVGIACFDRCLRAAQR